MPRERPVHRPRVSDRPDDDEDADLGIYEDDRSSVSSEMPLGHSISPGPTQNDVEMTAAEVPPAAAKPVEVPSMTIPNDSSKEATNLTTERSYTDEESDRGVKRVDIASAPQTPVTSTQNQLVGLREEVRVPSCTTVNTQELMRLTEDQSIPPRNTPATNDDRMEDLRQLESRLTGADSRRACYERAVSLLKTRCTSELLLPTRDQVMPAAGRCASRAVTEFFYIRQDKPQPMPPLKVWRGFHGNVYFEPINVSKFNVKPPTTVSQRRKTPKPQRTKFETGIRQMAVLDRNVVERRSEGFIDEDLTWVYGQQSTGSLRTQFGFTRPKIPYKPEKIMKGSVAKSMVASFSRRTPLSISGDGCSSPSKAPPFIQSQTQYSNSEKRRMFPDISSDYVSIQNPDTKTLVHIVSGRGEPPRAPVTSPMLTPH